VFAIVTFSVPASVKSVSEEKVLDESTLIPPLRVSAVEVVAPRPVTVESVSASEVRPEVEEIVIVEPDVETDVPPEPFTVRSPVVLLRLETTVEVSIETVGLWPAVTVTPVPPVKP